MKIILLTIIASLLLVSIGYCQESPLQITLSTEKPEFTLGEPIYVDVEYKNISGEPIRVLNIMVLEGYPLSFEIIRNNETTRVPFMGLKYKLGINWDEDFTTLQPGEILQRKVNLLWDEEREEPRYNLVEPGTYQVTAFYSGHWKLPETTSNTITIEIVEK